MRYYASFWLKSSFFMIYLDTVIETDFIFNAKKTFLIKSNLQNYDSFDYM